MNNEQWKHVIQGHQLEKQHLWHHNSVYIVSVQSEKLVVVVLNTIDITTKGDCVLLEIFILDTPCFH